MLLRIVDLFLVEIGYITEIFLSGNLSYAEGREGDEYDNLFAPIRRVLMKFVVIQTIHCYLVINHDKISGLAYSVSSWRMSIPPHGV